MAFAAYERDMREFVRLNQDLATEGGSALFPATAEALTQRNEVLRGLNAMPEAEERAAYTAMVLPDFDAAFAG